MARLTIKINRTERSATFFGPGTFESKEAIKELGRARWLSAEKAWRVESFTLSVDEVETLFPDSEVEESGAATEDSQLQVSSEKVEIYGQGVPSGLSVSELIIKIRAVLRQGFQSNTLVHGVISSLKRLPTGAVFIDIVDSEKRDERVSCVLWRGAEKVFKPLVDAGFELDVNLHVMFQVQVDFNAKGSSISLQIVRVVPEFTVAKLAASRELTNKRLIAEKIFDKNKQTNLPFLPRKLGILTSAGGTVINDFRSALDESRFGFELVWRHISVQGLHAAKDIIAGLSELSKYQGLDAILIFRGGGSAQELAVFSEYEVAKAVCLCPLPVFSAIGHQADQCSVQDVSFKAFGVPKDVGRYFADIVLDFRKRTEEASKSIVSLCERVRVEATRHLLKLTEVLPQLVFSQVASSKKQLASTISPFPAFFEFVLSKKTEHLRARGISVSQGGKEMLSRSSTALLRHGDRVIQQGEALILKQKARVNVLLPALRGAGRVVEEKETRVEMYQQLVQSNGPEAQLKRGFAIVRGVTEKKVLTTATLASTQKAIEIEFSDGTVLASVEKKGV